MNCIGYTTPSKKQYIPRKVLHMKYTKYTVLAMSALVLGTVGTKAVQAANANHPATTAASSQDAKVQEAVDAVNALFADKNHTKLASGVTAKKIFAAQKLVIANVSIVSNQYMELMKLCNDASNLLENSDEGLVKATKAVNDLFAGAAHIQLADGVTTAKIDDAEALVHKYAKGDHYKNLMSLCDRARDLLKNNATQDAKVQEAIDAVNALFADKDQTKLADGVTAAKIKAAQKLVIANVPVVGSCYLELMNLCNNATQLLNSNVAPDEGLEKATDAVNALFTDKYHTKLANGVTAEKIDAAEALVVKYATGDNYIKLKSLCNRARTLLENNSNDNPSDDNTAEVKAATKAVNALFADDAHTKLASGVTAEKIAAAEKLVAKIPTTNPNYAKLHNLCEKAKDLLKNETINNDIKAASKAVDALFANGSHTKLASGVTAEKIAAAEKLVAKIPTSNPDYAKLHNLCEKAKELLNNNSVNDDVMAATKAVNALFDDLHYTRLATGITADQINAAKALVAKIPTSNANYKRLNDLCEKAEKMFAEDTAAVKAATKAVNALFADQDHTKLATDVTLEKIDAAKKLTDKISTTNPNRAKLSNLCDKAKELFNSTNTNNVKAARKAADALFTNNFYIKLAPGVTMTQINEVKALVAKVPTDNGSYQMLQTLCEKAEKLFKMDDHSDLKVAINAVDALFADSSYNKLAAGVNSEKIDAALQLIQKLTDDLSQNHSYYTTLSALCHRARNLLDNAGIEDQIQAATDVVDALFSDSSHTALAASTNSAKIKAAEELVKKNVPSDDYRYSTLMFLCSQAKYFIKNSSVIRPASTEGEQKAIDAVKALFSDDTYTKLSDKANSAMVDKAVELIKQNVKPDNSNYLLLLKLADKANELLNQSKHV